MYYVSGTFLAWLRHFNKNDTPNKQIHDNPLSWLGLDTSIKNDTPDTQIHDEMSKPSQESGLSCICVSGVSRFIEVSKPSQESGLSCICLLGVSFLLK
jgi:hypothetical protein